MYAVTVGDAAYRLKEPVRVLVSDSTRLHLELELEEQAQLAAAIPLQRRAEKAPQRLNIRPKRLVFLRSVLASSVIGALCDKLRASCGKLPFFGYFSYFSSEPPRRGRS